MRDDKDERAELYKSMRSFIIFSLGMAAFIHEAFFVSLARVEVVVASLAMMGLPAALRLDESRRARD